MPHDPWLQLPASTHARPLLHGGRVLIDTVDGGVHAFDLASGTRRWSARVKGTSVQGLAIADGSVIATVQWGGVSSGRGIVFAVDPESGAIRWQRRADAAIGTAPCVVAGAVLFGTQTTGPRPREGTLYSLAPATGEPLWTRPGPAFEKGLVVAGGALLAPAGEGALFCVELASGATRWRVATDKFFTGPPAVAEETVYVGGQDGLLRALDLASGEERWRRALAQPWVATPLIMDGVVHVGSWDESLYALDAASGREVWRRRLGAMVASPAVALGGRVCVGCHDESVHVLDRADGTPAWVWQGPSAGFNAGVLAPPLPIDERLVVITRPGQLFVLDAATGAPLPPPVGSAAPPRRRATRPAAPVAAEPEAGAGGRRIGALALPSARLVVCDPISDPHAKALDRKVPAGPHPVFVALDADGSTVSWIEVRFRDAAVATWRAPRRAPRTVGVDSARVALLDRAAAERLSRDPDAADDLEPLYGETDAATGSGLWALASFAAGRAADVVACVSGAGDGEFPIRYGLDDRGRLVRVRVDFL